MLTLHPVVSEPEALLRYLTNTFSCPEKAGGTFPFLSSWKRKSLKPGDAQYLAMIKHPGPGLRGVRRCVLEPSSNRLAEQCDVAHLAQTPVHFPLQGEPPWPHPSQF